MKNLAKVGNNMKAATDREQLGMILSEIKNNSGISYYKILKECDIPVKAQKTLEKGTANYTIDTLFKFCKCIGATLYIKYSDE